MLPETLNGGHARVEQLQAAHYLYRGTFTTTELLTLYKTIISEYRTIEQAVQNV